MTRDFAHLGEDPAEGQRAQLYVYVPGAPVGWKRTNGNGKRRYTHPETRAKEMEIGQYAKVAMVGRPLLQGALRVEVIAWMPVPDSWSKRKKTLALGGNLRPTAKPDSDNILKLALDALNGIAWKDDAAVVDVRCQKKFGNPVQTVICVEAA